MNLKELLNKYIITIPPMQRDYAQGRNSEETTRESFLNVIYDHITNNKVLNLDFIYGYRDECNNNSSKDKDNNNSLILIDGQQRITTLWLLHLYFYSHFNGIKSEFLKNITYSSIDRAKYACEYMYNNKQRFEKKPSKIFLESLDFDMDWALDPTVIAILNMYDAIYEKFKDIVNDNSILDKLDNIHFSLTDMKKYNLGEELYITMNSRGKALTMFENFKAWVMRDEGINKDFSKTCSFENNWTELFWGMAQEKYDTCATHFFHFFGLYLRYENANENENNSLYKDFKNNLDKFNKSIYCPDGKLSSDTTGLFTHKALLLMDNVISYIDLCKNEIAFSLDKMDEINVMQFFAIIAFVEVNFKDNAYNIQNFKDWYEFIKRIINNNRENNENNTVWKTYLYIKHFKEISGDIISKLCNYKDKLPDYAKESTEEEIIKAKLIWLSHEKNLDWEKEINIAHQHTYFKGKIIFLLKYSQISDDDYNIELFKKYYKCASEIFNDNNLKDIHKLHRAFLSKHNYSWKADGVNGRNALGSGRYDLKSRLEWYDGYFLRKGENSYLFKDFLDEYDKQGRNLESMVENSLKNIELWNFQTDWGRYLFVRFPELLYIMNDNRYIFGEPTTPAYILTDKKMSKGARNVLLRALEAYMKEKGYNEVEMTDVRVLKYEHNKDKYEIISAGHQYGYNDLSNNMKIRKNNEEKCSVIYTYNNPEDFFKEIIDKLK